MASRSGCLASQLAGKARQKDISGGNCPRVWPTEVSRENNETSYLKKKERKKPLRIPLPPSHPLSRMGNELSIKYFHPGPFSCFPFVWFIACYQFLSVFPLRNGLRRGG